VRPPVEVADGVFRLGSDMVAWYLVAGEGGRLTAVDAGLAGFGGTLEADLAAIGRRVEDVEAVVLTHGDADHAGLAPRLMAAGARLLAHRAEDRILRRPGPKRGDASPRRFAAELWRPAVLRITYGTVRHSGGRPPRVEGAQLFDGDEVLDVPGRPRVVATHGHTAGHCVVHLPDRGVLFAGDALATHPLFTGGPDRVGLMPRIFNEDDAAALAALDALDALDASVILPGHGEAWHGTPAAAAAEARSRAGSRAF
jgi:glyoxylase-like metal-dependent hydrolase (beta-lactamase superfamily II)